jgi:cyclase
MRMLRPRLIPCLLIDNKGLVKTVNFKSGKYVGDPINTVRIFNEKEVDELIVLDIGASREKREPDYLIVERLARECRMPLCYGGGIKTVQQAQRIFGLGVEKVAISSAAIDDMGIVAEIAGCVGNQSVIVIVDVRKRSPGDSYEVWTHNGLKNTGKCPFEFAHYLENAGAGEIVVNSIDRDGTMQGYDLELIERMRNAVRLPITALGGAGSLHDIRQLIAKFGVMGAAAGSLFVFKGVYRAVLVNYPSRTERDTLMDGIPS